jgi:hypothetical protein
MLAAVVDSDGQANHIWRYHGTARPGLDRAAIVTFSRCFDFFHQVKVDKRTFLQ